MRGATTASSSSPTTARARARRSASATARRSRSSSAASCRTRDRRRRDRTGRDVWPGQRAPRRAREAPGHGRPGHPQGPQRQRLVPTPGSGRASAPSRNRRTERPDLVVCASGNLANVYFTGVGGAPDGRGARSRSTRASSRTLTAHPGIGFLLVRSADGPVVLGRAGHPPPRRRPRRRARTRSRRSGRARPTTCAGSTRSGTSATSSSNSDFDPDLGEVAAFEELVGSHGGTRRAAEPAVHPPSRGPAEPGPDPLDRRAGRQPPAPGLGASRSGSRAARPRWSRAS